MSVTWKEAAIKVRHAVPLVVVASAIGGAFGYLFTVHLVESFASEMEAVWITTVVFAVAALYIWAALRS
jgi:hypothetical protein